MPFTISHAAAALPVRRAAPWLPLDALVFGAMAPDFEYVLRLAVHGRYWHTPAGGVLLCVPAVLICCLAWRSLVRPALLPLLPPGMRPTVEPLPLDRPSVLAAVALAAWVGTLTHVLWDGLTHRTGWAVVRLPVLAEPALALGIGRPWYNLLQHASTMLGAGVLAAGILAWIHRHPVEARRFAPGQGWRVVRVAGSILGFAALAGIANGARAVGAGLEWMLGYGAVGGMAALAVGAVGYGLLFRLRT
jgi:hypothetical protein